MGNCAGEHILLIGNQGVGKNVLADRLLELVRLVYKCFHSVYFIFKVRHEREYIQLHRDTTVQTLTLFPSIIQGKLVWEVMIFYKYYKYNFIIRTHR